MVRPPTVYWRFALRFRSPTAVPVGGLRTHIERGAIDLTPTSFDPIGRARLRSRLTEIAFFLLVALGELVCLPE